MFACAFRSKPPALVCQIVQCRNLKQMDLGGASDPYVKVGVLDALAN